MISKRTKIFGLLTIPVLSILAFFWFNKEQSRLVTTRIAQSTSAAAQASANNAATQTVRTVPRSHDVASKSSSAVSSLALVRAAIQGSRDLQSLRDSLGSIPGVSELDRFYYEAAINEYCYGVAASEGWQKADKAFLVVDAKFIKAGTTPTIAPSDPKFAARQKARTYLSDMDGSRVCAAYLANPVSFDDLKRQWTRAAAAGDARAIASLSDLDLRQAAQPWKAIEGIKSSGDAASKPLLMTPDPSQEHIGKLTRALSSGDPSIVISLGPTLGQAFENGQFVFGPNQEPLTLELKRAMWPLLACQIGYDCGPTNYTLQSLCSQLGHCEIVDLESYYRASRFSASDIAQYEKLKPLFLEAMRSGDWSFMTYQSPRTTRGDNIVTPIRIPIRLGR